MIAVLSRMFWVSIARAKVAILLAISLYALSKMANGATTNLSRYFLLLSFYIILVIRVDCSYSP